MTESQQTMADHQKGNKGRAIQCSMYRVRFLLMVVLLISGFGSFDETFSNLPKVAASK